MYMSFHKQYMKGVLNGKKTYLSSLGVHSHVGFNAEMRQCRSSIHWRGIKMRILKVQRTWTKVVFWDYHMSNGHAQQIQGRQLFTAFHHIH